MVNYRLLHAEDYELLVSSLAHDEYHTTMSPAFFVEPETLTNVYEDEDGPVMFVRGKGYTDEDGMGLRLDIQYVSNEDRRRNRRVMLEGFSGLVSRAKANGFKKITFDSDVPLLRAFCVRRLGFREKSGQTLEFVL